MFCYQCEQTAGGKACTQVGVCGKSDEVANRQDQLIDLCKQLSTLAVEAKSKGLKTDKVDKYVIEGLFSTVTNVNFSTEKLESLLSYGANIYQELKGQVQTQCANFGSCPSSCSVAQQSKLKESTDNTLVSINSIKKRIESVVADIAGLEELLIYGLKGMGAYVHHASILGQSDEAVISFIHNALAYLDAKKSQMAELVALNLECGATNLKVMELLDSAHTSTYGHPTPTKVKITASKGKAILVSGHDLKDLEELLKQTQGKGINIYTHGEMLPAHGYPKLKAYQHLVGNYGGAWQDQQKEFDTFPGSILMTTNCIQQPKPSYINRIFTTGLVAFPGVRHIYREDFSSLIESALAQPGFAEEETPTKEILVGFGHNAVLSVAPQVISAIQDKRIRHIFLVGGCDGAKSGRNYYTDLATSIPNDCLILTLACGKFRFNKLEFGTIDGIPRLLDCGQCNDAYSAIKVAVELSKVFGCDVNELPLSLILSWYEQKAVVILLTLLSLGIKNIRIGPSLPAFISPAVLDVLVNNYGLKPISTAQDDLKQILG